MAYAAHHGVFAGFAPQQAVADRKTAAEKPGILGRIIAAVSESRQMHANRDIADFIERSGGRLTDNMEREMMERFLSANRNFRR